MLKASWFLATYLDQVYTPSHPGIQPRSVEQLRCSISLLERYAGGPLVLTDLSRLLVGAWMRWLEQQRAPATVNAKRSAILTLWRAAAEADLANPCPRIPKLVEPRRIPTAWTMKEISAILAACAKAPGRWGPLKAQDAWPGLILLLWDTGARIGTAMAARLADLDLRRRTWHAPATHMKGRREDRLFVLSRQTIAALGPISKPDRERLFPYPFHPRQLWPDYKAILRRANLPDDRVHLFHCVRRSAESHAARRRGVEWAAAAVGHRREVAERSYISPQICRQPRLIDALPRPKF